ncbi:MAG: galactokinase [Oscillospiraceae bacterium]|nr:galactokinase [Oscillospiraceae bacterium]
MNARTLLSKLASGAADARLSALYGAQTGKAVARCRELVGRFTALYGERDGLHIFSAPGRTEIGGNHTDHNHGHAIAAAVNLDTLAVAAQSPLPIVRIQSEGHPETMVTLRALEPNDSERNTANALLRGVCAYFSHAGYPVGGFDAVTTSAVSVGSGLSSSAAFSVLAGVTLDHLYGAGQLPPMELAVAGRYAENRYFGKPSGMLDQTVSAFGGILAMDFGAAALSGGVPEVRRLDCDFAALGHKLCITGPIGSHANLQGEYAAVTGEMRLVAERFGKERLREVGEEAFQEALPALHRDAALPGRAILRAMHFFSENRRVLEQIAALESGNFERFLSLVRRSGRSSFMYLQNVCHGEEEGLAVALGLSEHLLDGRGATRVHGGGFAGTIQAFVPPDLLETYTRGMERVFGAGACQMVEVRTTGATMVL